MDWIILSDKHNTTADMLSVYLIKRYLQCETSTINTVSNLEHTFVVKARCSQMRAYGKSHTVLTQSQQ